MDKNFRDKILFYAVIGLLFMGSYVSIEVIKHIHAVSYNMGIIAEKVEELRIKDNK